MTIYCANECEAEAVAFVLHDNHRATPLCATCETAYEWGQTNPEAERSDIIRSDTGVLENDARVVRAEDGTWSWQEPETKPVLFTCIFRIREVITWPLHGGETLHAALADETYAEWLRQAPETARQYGDTWDAEISTRFGDFVVEIYEE